MVVVGAVVGEVVVVGTGTCRCVSRDDFVSITPLELLPEAMRQRHYSRQVVGGCVVWGAGW